MPYASKHMPKLYQSGGSSYAKHDAKARELGWFGVWGGLATGRCGFWDFHTRVGHPPSGSKGCFLFRVQPSFERSLWTVFQPPLRSCMPVATDHVASAATPAPSPATSIVSWTDLRLRTVATPFTSSTCNSVSACSVRSLSAGHSQPLFIVVVIAGM